MPDTPIPAKVLLVDDLPENLLALEAIIADADVEVLKAASGEQALELLLGHDVALALLDVQMPGMDGYELAEFMRGAERTRHVPIIFLTAGLADRERRFRGYEAGAVDFLQKPIDADILRSKTRVFFDLYRQRHLIARQRDALRVAHDALARADRNKDEFIAVLAHELRNPMAALLAGLRIMGRDPLSERGADVRQRMEYQLLQLSRLVDDLLDIARVNEGKILLRKELVQLDQIARAAADIAAPLFEEAGHAFTLDLPEEPVTFTADPVRMVQVIANLLNNAAKYTPPGGAIALTARHAEGAVSLAVSDNGLGIPADKLESIFELFGQVEEHGGRAHGGLGIGLSLVSKLVRLHGGTIRAQSAGPGQGSTFVVTIPVG